LFGRGRAPDARRDGERMDRLQQAILFFDESLPDIKDGVPAPVIEPSMRRVLVDGCQRWTVHPGLRAAFRAHEVHEVIRIPVDFLRHARCRYSGLLYMAAAAWAERELDKKWVRRADETTLRLRVPITEIRRVRGFEGSPSDMAR